jgi:putative protease
MEEQEVGKVSNFFAKINVAAIKVTDGVIKVGDTLHFKGQTTDFQDTVSRMEVEGQSVDEAKPGDEIGIKVKDRVREHDSVYKT